MVSRLEERNHLKVISDHSKVVCILSFYRPLLPYALYAQNGDGGSNDNWSTQTALTNNGLVGNGLAARHLGGLDKIWSSSAHIFPLDCQ
jgi:hypothetical protein